MVNVKYLSCTMLLISMQQLFSMELAKEKEVATTALSKIKTWEDINKFTGCFVAYKKGDLNNPITYGYIEFKDGKRSVVTVLEKGMSLGLPSYLMNSLFENSVMRSLVPDNLSMGLATTKEIDEMFTAIQVYQKSCGNPRDGDNLLEYTENVKEQLRGYAEYLYRLKKEYAEHMVKCLHNSSKRDEAEACGPFILEAALRIASFRYNIEIEKLMVSN